MNPERPSHSLPPAPRAGGFTLLEVMAAVAVMAMAFIVLAQANIQGIMAEGSARQRLAAARIADRTMQELEVKLISGSLPLEVGIEEVEEPPFIIETEIALFDLDLPEVPNALGETSEDETEPDSAIQALETLSEREDILHWIQVRVIWGEGAFERAVTRTTFGYDAALLQAGAQQATQGAQGEPGVDPNFPNTPPPGGAELTAPRIPR